MSCSKKHILILGASLMQRPSILAAKEMGCRVSIVDGNPNAMCIPLADYFEPVDLKDSQKIVELALRLKDEEGLNGVFTAGTDFSSVVALANQACGFVGHSYQASLNASDKLLMRKCFKAANVPSPHFIQVDESNIVSICRTADRLGQMLFPLVVKPVDNMGARGCRIIRNRSELEPALKSAISNSRSGRGILEDYMEGPEFSIDALVYNGSVTICGMADRHILYPPYFIEMGHTMPSATSNDNMLSLYSTFVKGIKALDLSCGAAKADIKLTPKGPMIGEIAARLSGGYMSGWTFPYASSCPLTEQAERIALNLEPTWLLEHRVPVDTKGMELPFALYQVPYTKVCAERAWISLPGNISSIYGIDEAKKLQFVNQVFPRAKANDCVVFPKNNVEKCGNVIATASDRHKAIFAAEKAISKILLRLQPNNDKTEAFLSGLDMEEGFPPKAFYLPEDLTFDLEKECKSMGQIPLDSLVVPKCIQPHLETLVDWNYRTLKSTLELYKKYCPDSKGIKVSALLMWQCCIKGGIQGMLYLADSLLEGKGFSLLRTRKLHEL